MADDAGTKDERDTDVVIVRSAEGVTHTPLPAVINASQEGELERQEMTHEDLARYMASLELEVDPGEVTQEDLAQYLAEIAELDPDSEATAECKESELEQAVTGLSKPPEDIDAFFADLADDIDFGDDIGFGDGAVPDDVCAESHQGSVESLSSGSVMLGRMVLEREPTKLKISDSRPGALYDPRSTPNPDSRPGDSKLTEDDDTPIPLSPVPISELGEIIEESDMADPLSDEEFIRCLRETGRITDVSTYCLTDAQDILGDEVIHQGFDDITLVFKLLDQIKMSAEKHLGTGKFSLSLEDSMRGGSKEGFINFDNPEDPLYAITMLTGTEGLVSGRVELNYKGIPSSDQLENFIMKGADLVAESIPHILKGEPLKVRAGVTPRVLGQHIKDLHAVYKVHFNRARRQAGETLSLPIGTYSLDFFRGPYRRDPVVVLSLGWKKVYDDKVRHVQFMPKEQHGLMIIQYSGEHNIPRLYEFFPKESRMRLDEELAVVGPGGRRFSMSTPGIEPFVDYDS